MIRAVERLRNVILACFIVPSDEVEKHILLEDRKYRDKIIKFHLQNPFYALTKDKALTVDEQYRESQMQLRQICDKYKGCEQAYEIIASSHYKGLLEEQLVDAETSVRFDAKQYSRFVTILRDAGFIMQTQRRLLFVSKIVGGADPAVLELFNASTATENTLESFTDYCAAMQQIKDCVVGYLAQQQQAKIADLIKYITLRLPSNRYIEDCAKLIEQLISGGLLSKTTCGSVRVLELRESGCGCVVESQYPQFDSLGSLPACATGVFSDQLFLLMLRKQVNLSRLLGQYVTHDTAKSSQQMLKTLRTIYPIQQSDTAVACLDLDDAAAAALPQGRYGKLLRDASARGDGEDAGQQAPQLYEDVSATDLFERIQEQLRGHQLPVTYYRVASCSNIYKIIDQMKIVTKDMLYRLYQQQLIGKGSFVSVCYKLFDGLLADLQHAKVIKAKVVGEYEFLAPYNMPFDEQLIDQQLAKVMKDSTQQKEDSLLVCDDIIETSFFEKSKVQRLLVFSNALKHILSNERFMKLIFKENMFDIDHIIQFFTMRQILQISEYLDQLFTIDFESIIEEDLLEMQLKDLPEMYVSAIFGQKFAYSRIMENCQEYCKDLVDYGILQQSIIAQAVTTEVLATLRSSQKERIAYELNREMHYNVEIFSDCIFDGNTLKPEFEGLNYLKYDISTYFCEIFFDLNIDDFKPPLSILVDFAQRVKSLSSNLPAEFVRLCRGNQVLESDYVIDEDYEEIMEKLRPILNEYKNQKCPRELAIYNSMRKSHIISIDEYFTQEKVAESKEELCYFVVHNLLVNGHINKYVILLNGQRIYPHSLKQSEVEYLTLKKEEKDKTTKTQSIVIKQEKSQESDAVEHFLIPSFTTKHSESIIDSESSFTLICRKLNEKLFYNKQNMQLIRCTDIPVIIADKTTNVWKEYCQYGYLSVFETFVKYIEEDAVIINPQVKEYCIDFRLLNEEGKGILFPDELVDYTILLSKKHKFNVLELKELVHSFMSNKLEYQDNEISSVVEESVELLPFEGDFFNLPKPKQINVKNENYSLEELLHDADVAQASTYDSMYETSQREMSEMGKKLNLKDFIKKSQKEIDEQKTNEDSTTNSQPQLSQIEEHEMTRLQHFEEYYREEIDNDLLYLNFIKELEVNEDREEVQISSLSKDVRTSGYFYSKWNWSSMYYTAVQDKTNVNTNIFNQIMQEIRCLLQHRNGCQLLEILQYFNHIPPCYLSRALNCMRYDGMVEFKCKNAYPLGKLIGDESELDYIVILKQK